MKNKMYVGCDISKDKVDIYVPFTKGKKLFKINRNETDLKAFIQKIDHHDVEYHFVMESTGIYSQDVHRWLSRAQIANSVVNAYNVKYYAKSLGLLAKTDALDAKLIAGYGEAYRPRISLALSDDETRLRALTHRRDQIVDMRVQEENHKSNCRDKFVMTTIAQSIKLLKATILEIDNEMRELVASNQRMQKIFKIITSIRGVGEVSAYAIICELPEIGTISNSQIAALVGVAPYNNDSGTMKGYRSISGGRHYLRKKLYMTAMATIQHNIHFGKKYAHLKDKGKASKVAIVAIMRKIMMTINSMVKSGQLWKDNHLPSHIKIEKQ